MSKTEKRSIKPVKAIFRIIYAFFVIAMLIVGIGAVSVIFYVISNLL